MNKNLIAAPMINGSSANVSLVPELRNYCLLAGNSRISCDNNVPILEPQLAAFGAAVRHATRLEALRGCNVNVSVAFDHKGVFRKQFLRDGLSNSRKRHPRLIDLLPEFSFPFVDIANKIGFSAERIFVLHEDSAKTHIEHLTSNALVSESMAVKMIVETAVGSGNACGIGKATCAAITAEYYRAALRAASSDNDENAILEVYIESDPWTLPATYVRGVTLAHKLKIRAGIRLNLVTRDGQVTSGTIGKSN